MFFVDFAAAIGKFKSEDITHTHATRQLSENNLTQPRGKIHATLCVHCTQYTPYTHAHTHNGRACAWYTRITYANVSCVFGRHARASLRPG